MKLDFYTALVVIASSASAINIVKNDAQLDGGLSKGVSEPAMAA